MRFPELNHRKKGFTLTELLIVVAIIGILLAIAVPSVLAYYKELKITELDDSARTIFVAAQNRLTALINAGEDLSGVGAKIVYPTGTTGKPDLNYIQNNSASIASLHNILPAGSVDTQLQDHNFIIEFNPQSGAVYAVWYWEKYDFTYQNDGTNITDKTRRVNEGRMVGYYGGENIDRLTAGQMPFPSVKLINAEELRVQITVPKSTTVPLTDGSIRVDVSVNGELILKDANLWQEKTGTVVLDTLKLPGAGQTMAYPWDASSNSPSGWVFGDKFKNLKKADTNTALATTPGDDITVSVKLSYNGTLADGTTPLPQTVTVTTNSLFESVKEDPTASGTYIASIAYGRHLQNLHDSTSTTGSGVFRSGVLANKNNITKAVQTKDINFNAVNPADPNNESETLEDVYYWNSIYHNSASPAAAGSDPDPEFAPYLTFHPINNNKLVEYNGGGHEIRNMVAGHYMYGGLFSYIVKGYYYDIVLINPQVHAEGATTDVDEDPAKGQPIMAGALVGIVSGDVKIENCRVYNEYDGGKDPDGANFGADFDLDDLKVYDKALTGPITPETPDYDKITSGLYVKRLVGRPHIGAPAAQSISGGLIGEILTGGKVTIDHSFVSVINIGSKNVGGLIGQSDGEVTIENSYSASYVYGNRCVAGLIGLANGKVTLENSYAAGEIVNGYDKGFKGAGLFHYDEYNYLGGKTLPADSSVTNCYAAVKYVNADGYPRKDDNFKKLEGSNVPSLVGFIYGTYKGDTDNLYITQTGVLYGYDNAVISATGAGEKVGDKGTPSDCGTSVSASELWTKLNESATSNSTTDKWVQLNAADKNPQGVTTPYRLLKELNDANSLTLPYPYPMLKNMPHYGDWLENKANGSLVNWEQYPASAGDPEYGFWGLMGSGGEPINNLKSGDSSDDVLEYAIADGYGVLVPQDTSGNSTEPEVFIGTKTTKETLIKIANAYTKGGATYDLYVIPYTAPTTAPTSYYTAVTVNGSTFWYNPDFACEVLERKEGTDAPDEPVEKKNAEGDPAGAATSTTKGVVIRTARQLANLPVYTGATLDETNHAQLRAYTQLLDIDYGEYEGIKDTIKDAPQSPAALTKTDDDTKYGSYDGRNFVIKNLFIRGNKNVGLFGELKLAVGTTGIRNVFLVDVTVTGTGDNVGALVGSAGGSTVVDHCGVYVSPEKYTTCTVTGQQTVGGLIGMVGSSTTVQNSFAAVRVSGTTYVGGFAGQINGNRKLANCYSGGYTQDGQYKADTANVTATGPDGIAGGFAGRMVNYNNKDNKPTNLALSGVLYSTCSVKGNTVGLLIGRFDSWTGAVPADVTYKDFKDLFSTTTGLTLYATGVAFNSAGDPMTSGLNDEPYLTTGNAIPRGTLDDAHTHNYDEKLKTAAYPYKVADGQTEHHGDWVTFPMLAYIEKYQKGTDAPTYRAYAASVDADGDVNVAFNNLMSQDALADAHMDLVNDYYRIISPQPLTTEAFTLDGTVNGTLVLDKTNFNSDGTVKLGTETYYVYDFLGATGAESASKATNYYHKLVNGNYTFLFNSHFGLEAFDVTARTTTPTNAILEKPEAAGKNKDKEVVEFNDKDGNPTTEATGVVIRSARQLANMQAYTNHTEPTISGAAQSWTYDQLMNVDFKTYNGTNPGSSAIPGKDYGAPTTPITRLTPAVLNNGAYDGHSHTISNLYIGAGTENTSAGSVDKLNPAGLFGTVTNGTVANVFLVDVDVEGDEVDTAASTTKVSLAVGGLVGQLNGGTVDNCGIYVSAKEKYGTFTVTGSGGNGVGGLIGQVTKGTVSNSFAAVMVMGNAATVTASATPVNSVGGLIGQIGPDVANISNCYVGGYVDTDGTYKPGSVNVSGKNNVGGFVGSITGTVTFSGVNYSTASVYGPNAATVGLFCGNVDATNLKKDTTTTTIIYALAKAFTDELDAAGAPTGNKVVTAARDEAAYLSNPEIVRKNNETPDKHFDTFHYNRGNDIYPYQTADGQTEHHGDWIGLTKGAYYDTVSSTVTGYYANGVNGGNLGANTLSKRGSVTYCASDDGYVFLSETDLGDVALGINGATFMLEQKKDAADNPVKETIGTIEYYVYYVPADALNTMPVDAYYFTVSVNGQFFTANFAFAGEIFDYGKIAEADYGKPAEKEDLTTADSAVAIRSPRQLANAGIWTSRSEVSGKIARGLKYEQLLDINYDEYKKISETKMPKIYKENKTSGSALIPYNHVPITLSGSDAGYEGHGYEIRGLLPGYLIDYDGSTFALNGLFGRVKGASVSGVNLIDPRVVGYSGNKAVAQLDETDGTVVSGSTYVLDVSELVNNGTLTAGGSVAAETFTDVSAFTIQFKHKGESKPVNESAAIWEYDGESKYNGQYYISFGSKSNTGSGKHSAYIKFTTSGAATVKVWWVQDKANSVLNLYKGGVDDSNIVTSAATGTVGKAYFTVFNITGSGTYYLGDHVGNGNKYYRVEVTEPAISGVSATDPTTSKESVVDPAPAAPAPGNLGVNDDWLAKGILAPVEANYTISNKARVRVGALAGILDGATVKQSGAYVEKDDSGAYTTPDKAYNNYIVKNDIAGKEDAVGGFAGNITGGTVNDCFAAVKVIGVRVAGGFAGKLLDGAAVNDCYVGGHTVDGTFGNKDKNNIMVNISTTDKTNRTFTGGFVGQMSGTTFTGINYTTASVGMEYNKYQSGSNKDTISTIGQFAGDGKPKKNTGNLYSIGSIFRKGESSGYDYFPQGTKAGFKDNKDNDLYPVRNETYLNNGIVAADVTSTATPGPYDDAYETARVYPYASGQTVHHGDWTERYGFIYYEMYDDEGTGAFLVDIPDVGENVGFYAVLKDASASDGKRIVNTLSTTGHVIDSGYMILTDRKVGTIAFSIFSEYGGKQTSGKETYLNVSYDNSSGTVKDQNDISIANYFYVIPFDKINNAPSEEYYEKVTINGQPYMLNPYFACEAVNVGLTKEVDGQYVMDYSTVRKKPGLKVEVITRNNMGGEDKELEDVILAADTAPVLIRSPWNLASMARYTREGNTASRVLPVSRTWNFVQMLDIDYKTYVKGRVFDGNPSNKDKDGKSLAGTDDNVGQVAAMLGGEISTTQPDGTIEKIKKAGSYDGLGHTIKNLYLASDTDDSQYIGLFGLVTNGSTVKDVKLQDIHVNAWGGNSGGCYVGTIAAQIDNGTVENVTAKNVEMDFHKVVYYNKEYKESGDVKLNAVGGAVGQMKNGTVKNVLVDDLSINFNSNKTEFSYKLESDSYSKGTGTYTSSVHKDQGSINIGGAVGEINASASGARVSVSDVYVVNPLIEANKGQNNSVGGVVGKAVGKANIASSGVYHVKTTDSSGAEVTAAKMYEDGGVLATAGTTADHTDHVGGFAGKVGSGVTVTNSFAAVKVTGKLDVGGFAGRIADATIENCFAGGHTESGQYATGTGNANVTATDTGTAYAGGFAGSVDNTGGKLTFKGTVYSTASVEGANRGAFLGNEAGTDAMKAAKGGATLYATGISADTSEELWDEATEYGLLTGLDVPTGSADATNHYDTALDGKTYPFKNETKVNLDGDPTTPAVDAHFGDWADAKMVIAFYYELENGTYRFYSLRGEIATGKFGAKPIDSLCKDRDGKAITEWGYGFMAPDGVKVTVGSTEIGDEPTGGIKTALEKEFGAGVKVVAGSTSAKPAPDTWTFTDSTNSISFYVNTAYAAAIEAAEKTSSGSGLAATTLGKTEKTAYQIRTVRQLDNMDGTGATNLNTNYFKQTHDISGNGETYSGVEYFGGHFNGQSYRILDLTITTGGLFNEVYGDVVLENIVLYAPANNGNITASGNAGGLVAATKGTSLTIRNCAVAGYIITAGTGGNAGGLVGSHEAGTLTIEKSEATTTLSGTSVGGLVGAVGAGAGDVTITDSYAGGKITSASTSAGGVIGSQNTGSAAKITYKNVYAYVDMTKVNKNNQKYGIGPQVNILSKDNVGFWGGGVENVNTDDHDLRKALLSLVDWSDDPSKETASEQTYIPETTNGLTNRQSLDATSPYYDVFPYEAYVTDWQGENVHYGDWPRPSDYAAAFYWEKEKVEKSDGTTTEEYHFYAYGAEYMEDGSILGSELIDTLCYSHHINERAGIVDYGYGYFYPTTDRSGKTTGEFDMKVSGAPTGVTRNFVDISADLEEMQTAMFEAFGLSDRAGDYKVQVLVEVGTAYKRDENWTLTNSNTTSGFYQAFGKNGLAMKVNPAFGAGIYNSNFEYGKSEDKDLDVTTPAQVRTAQQFRNVMLNSNVNNLDYVALTHDIDFADESYTPGVLQPQLVNGNGYRILDVKIQTAGDASLFTKNNGNVVIKNLVIYSPDNTGLIESISDKNAAGFFAAQPDYNVIIENCVIAGYTIKGGGYIGGFIGQTRSSSGNRIADSQAYVTLDCHNKATAAGGLVGQIRASGTINNRKDDTTKTSDAGIFDCYTGGKVINATSSTTVGGIFGVVNNSVTVKNSYTYMDLKDTSLGSAKVYPIGSDTNATITDCSYYEECFTGTTTQATKAQISDLAVKAGENAEYSWWPEDPATATAGYYGWISNQMGGFPFRAVASYTEDGVKHYVHYGQWPFDAQVMGIAYWELYSDGEVGLQIVGVDRDGNLIKTTDGKIIDTLRKPNPTGVIATSNEIVSTGYVSFSTIYNMSISMDGSAGTKLTNTATVAKIAQALDVQLKGVCTQVSAFTTPEGTGEGTALSATVLDQNLYYSSGFAGVSYTTFGTVTSPFEIRTVAQLDNIPKSSAACFKQTHDLYGETYTKTNGDPKYTGAVDFAGNYNGQGYRILELNMKAKDLGSATGLGLFNSTRPGSDTTVTIENVILYSPKGTATIEATITSNSAGDMPGVGGIVGQISGGGSTVTTIQNCVVAGYSITARKNDSTSTSTFNVGVGGIAGFAYYGFKIQNCEAVNSFELDCKGGGVGGILGALHSNGMSTKVITSSYAGGSIKTTDKDVHSGGIFGYDASGASNRLEVDKCYTYVDLHEVKMPDSGSTCNVYVIGDNDDMLTGKTNYYLDGISRYPAISGMFTEEKNMNGKPSDLKSIFKDGGAYTDGFGEVDYTYVPASTGDTGWAPSATAYPFPAVVTVDETDSGGATTKKYVHYGDPPTT